MKRFFKIIQWLILLAFIAIQFFPPEKNIHATPSPDSLAKKFPVPDEVRNILATSCNDCHSDNTRYPWYTHIQPVGWWLQHHVDEGRAELNFDIFSSYSARRQYRKFEQIKKLVEEAEMPLPSYILIHRDAILTVGQEDALMQWAELMKKRMQLAYPPDSLKKK